MKKKRSREKLLEAVARHQAITKLSLARIGTLAVGDHKGLKRIVEEDGSCVMETYDEYMDYFQNYDYSKHKTAENSGNQVEL